LVQLKTLGSSAARLGTFSTSNFAFAEIGGLLLDLLPFSLATRLPFLRVAMSRKLNRLAVVFGSPAGGEDNGPSARGDG